MLISRDDRFIVASDVTRHVSAKKTHQVESRYRRRYFSARYVIFRLNFFPFLSFPFLFFSFFRRHFAKRRFWSFSTVAAASNFEIHMFRRNYIPNYSATIVFPQFRGKYLSLKVSLVIFKRVRRALLSNCERNNLQFYQLSANT